MPYVDWKKRAKEAERRLDDYVHYAVTYGNAEGECETGYPQHPGYICGLCRQDRSVKRVCGRKSK